MPTTMELNQIIRERDAEIARLKATIKDQDNRIFSLTLEVEYLRPYEEF